MKIKEKGKTIEDIKIGEKASLSVKIRERDIRKFAEATGDFNPLHLDEGYAKNTSFKGRIAHGMMVASLFSNIIGTTLPGPGTLYVSQTLNFKRPVRIDDVLEADVEVAKIKADRGRVVLLTSCRNQDGDLVLEGEAVVSPRKKIS